MNLRDRVVATLQETVCRGKDFSVADEDSLLDAGLIDSLGILELVDVLRSRFDIAVEEDELIPENLDSVAALRAFLGRKGVSG